MGALDGKHILLKAPNNSGSFYFNYKNNFSIVLLALVDADYKFLYIDIGKNGRVSDGGVFRESSLSNALETNSLNLPSPTSLPGDVTQIPYVIVADDAFPLKPYLMKPYGQRSMTMKQRIFNYRLSRARRIVENAFGILANRFRVFMTPIALQPDSVEKVVLACCSLHNFLRARNEGWNIYTPQFMMDREDHFTHDVIEGEWRSQPIASGMTSLGQQGSNRSTSTAQSVREHICNYFSSDAGSVPWQMSKI